MRTNRDIEEEPPKHAHMCWFKDNHVDNESIIDETDHRDKSRTWNISSPSSTTDMFASELLYIWLWSLSSVYSKLQLLVVGESSDREEAGAFWCLFGLNFQMVDFEPIQGADSRQYVIVLVCVLTRGMSMGEED